MCIAFLCFLSFCGHSSSLLSLNWDRSETARGDIRLRGMPERGRFPFMAYVIGDDAVGCSATIVSLKAVLTAATCIYGPKAMKVWAGNTRLLTREDFQPPTQHRGVSRVKVFDADDMDRHDVGVAWLEAPWQRSDYVGPVSFWVQTPLLKFEFLEPVTLLSWGFGGVNVTDKVLRKDNGYVGSNVMCPLTYLQLQRNIMCSNEGATYTTCKGDKGGAVIGTFPLLGMVQIGMIKGQVPSAAPVYTEPPEHVMDPTCRLPSVSTMYTFVGFYREWLLPLIDKDPLTYDFSKPYTKRATANKSGDQAWNQELKSRRQGGTVSTGAVTPSQHLFLPISCLLLQRCFCQSLSAL